MARLGKEMGAAAAALLVAAAFAAPSVEVTNVQQQYPWTNTVDITYTVQGVNLTHQTNRTDHIVNDTYFVTFEAKNGNNAIKDVNGNSVFTNALVNGNGTFTAQWQPQANLQLTGNNITPSVFRGEENAYLVVDLDTWKVWLEPMSTQEASNQRYSKAEYKTTKMVFRRIPAGNYTIGDSIYPTLNPVHSVNVPVDYYIGIFELTKAQYQRMILSENPTDSQKPADYITYNTMRGNASPQVAAGPGPLGNLNEKTQAASGNSNLFFDLPTESMWEIAARAGSTTRYINNQTEYDPLSPYAWTHRGAARDVGNMIPNAWGIYDMQGNASEHCRDKPNNGNLATLQPNALIPVTVASSGLESQIQIRGSWTHTDEILARLSDRSYRRAAVSGSGERGFRLAIINPLNK